MRVIHYVISGRAHLPYLVVSLDTLRQHWDGEVVVNVWPESVEIVRRIAQDKDLRIRYMERAPAYRGKNDQFVHKIAIAMKQLSDDVFLYLDADTAIHGSLGLLFYMAEQFGFAATRFNQWVTTGGIVRGRLNTLRQFPEIDVALIDELTSTPYPSLNGGVWAARPNSPILPLWHEWTMAARSTFIADEKVLHLMIPRFPHTEMEVIGIDGQFNCSPIYQSADLLDKNVIVRHFHGDCNVRLGKSRRGFDLWAPMFQRCLDRNVGGVCEWFGEIKNKWMLQLPKDSFTYWEKAWPR